MFTVREHANLVNMEEQKIVEQALENLKAEAGFEGKWLADKAPPGLDGVLILKYGKEQIKLNVEVKKELRHRQLLQIEKQAKENNYFMVIAERIIPKIKEELRRQDIAYLEGNGNLYLHQDKFFFWLDFNQPGQSVKNKPNRAFTKTGLKVLFFLLQVEGAENYSHRIIAQLTGTALGNVSNILKGLQETGFLLKLNDREYKLKNKKDLFDKWMTAYAQILKPTLEIGSFRLLKNEDFNNWGNLPLNNGKSWWGGEPAGEKLTKYLKPEILTIYTLETRHELIRNYRLIPDPKGNVKVYSKFWQYDERNSEIVSPLLIYADLMNTGDRRCIETAEKIYNEHLQAKF